MTLHHPVKPGLYSGIDIREYHSCDEALSKSGLDDMAKAPLIFKAMRGPLAPTREETTSQLHGNLAHCAILEPDEFLVRYQSHPDMHRSTTRWKAIVETTPAGVTPIQKTQFQTAVSQARSVRSLPNVFRGKSMAEILEYGCGEPEVSAFWNDPETGVLCRCRPDYVHALNADEVLLVDVKTFGNATPYEFAKQVGRMAYHVQDMFYSDGYALASGKRVAGFVFVAVEDRFPFAAASYQLGEESRAEGYAEYRRLVDLYAECKRTEIWPGYADQTTMIELPTYMLGGHDVSIEYVPG